MLLHADCGRRQGVRGRLIGGTAAAAREQHPSYTRLRLRQNVVGLACWWGGRQALLVIVHPSFELRWRGPSHLDWRATDQIPSVVAPAGLSSARCNAGAGAGHRRLSPRSDASSVLARTSALRFWDSSSCSNRRILLQDPQGCRGTRERVGGGNRNPSIQRPQLASGQRRSPQSWRRSCAK